MGFTGLIVLAAIPIINFCLQYHFSKQEKTLKIFKRHRTCYRGDWIFLPINILFAFLTITIAWQIVVPLFITSLLFNAIVHYLRSLDKKVENTHLITSHHISKSWRIHMLFSSIEMTIILIILTSVSYGRVLYTEMWLIAIFVGIMDYGEYRVHHKLYRSDVVVTILLWGALVIKLLALIYN